MTTPSCAASSSACSAWRSVMLVAAVHRRCRRRRRRSDWWWLAAVAIDQLGVYFVRSTRWRLNSASHFAERFGLIIIIAIGESIVAVGTATSSAELTVAGGRRPAVRPGDRRVPVVAVLRRRRQGRPRRCCADRQGSSAPRLARDSYTYVHFLFVVGIVFVAFGLVVLIDDDGPHRRRPLRPVRRHRLLPRRPRPVPAAQRRRDQRRPRRRRARAARRHPDARRPQPARPDRRACSRAVRARALRGPGVPRAARTPSATAPTNRPRSPAPMVARPVRPDTPAGQKSVGSAAGCARCGWGSGGKVGAPRCGRRRRGGGPAAARRRCQGCARTPSGCGPRRASR